MREEKLVRVNVFISVVVDQNAIKQAGIEQTADLILNRCLEGPQWIDGVQKVGGLVQSIESVVDGGLHV